MKKTYMTPALEVEKTTQSQMIAASVVEYFNSSLDYSGIDADNALVREFGLYLDE